MVERAAGRGLSRGLRPWGLFGLTLAALSPATSVFITGAGLLHFAGTGAALGLIIGAVIAFLATLLYAELGAAYPSAGGVYPSIGAVLGPGPAFVVVCLSLLTSPAYIAFGALGLSDYLHVLLPAVPSRAFPAALILVPALLAVLNIRANVWVTGGALLFEVAAVTALAAAAGGHIMRPLSEVLAHPVILSAAGALQPASPLTLALGVVLGAMACSGAVWGAFFAEEMEGASRRIARVLGVSALCGALLVAAPLILVTLGAGDLRAILSDPAPLASFMIGRWGRGVGMFMSAAVCLAMFNNLIALMLVFSRFLYSTARERIWPAPVAGFLTRLHPTWRSPWAATLCLTAASLAFLLVGEPQLLVMLGSEVFTPIIGSVAILVGRPKGLTGKTTFGAPLYPAIPVLGLLISAGFILADLSDPGTGRRGLAVLLTVVAASSLGYWGWLRRRPAALINPVVQPGE